MEKKQTLREAIEEFQAKLKRHGWVVAADDVGAILARFPKPSSMTSHCEITVAIDSHGRWSVDSWKGSGAKENVSDLAEDYVSHRIVADVPLPESVTVEGTVTP